MNRSAVTATPSANMCTRHPGYELTYFNSKEGRKQCLICIMHSSISEGGRERFCLKHPGYENSFYCYNDQKVCCEKCLNYHKKHKLESIALKAENLRERFDDYKVDFIDISQQWIAFYNEVKARKDTNESSIEATSKAIESIFDSLIQRLNKKKVEAVTEFKERAKKAMVEFDAKFAECETDVKDISQHTDDFNRLEELFKEGNNLEVILRSMELGIEDLIDNYCPFLKEKLEHHKEALEEIKDKTGYDYTVENKVSEKELNKFIDNVYAIKKISYKPKETDSQKPFEQPLSPPISDLPFKKEISSSIKELFLHKFDSKGSLWIYQNQMFTAIPFNHKIKDMKNPEKMKSFRSSSGHIFAFEDTNNTKTIYRYLPDSMTFDIAFTLPFAYTNITITENKEDFYIGGTAIESNAPQILYCDLATGDIEPISSGLSKLSEFLLVIVEHKYLYALELKSHKAYFTDITSPLTAKQETVFEWEEVAIKDSINVQLVSPLWVCEVENFIMIVGGNESALLDWKKGEVVGHVPLKDRDTFMDGLYTNGKEVWAFGRHGVHFYSVKSNKWTFILQN